MWAERRRSAKPRASHGVITIETARRIAAGSADRSKADLTQCSIVTRQYAACGLRIDQARQHLVGRRGTAQFVGARSCERDPQIAETVRQEGRRLTPSDSDMVKGVPQSKPFGGKRRGK